MTGLVSGKDQQQLGGTMCVQVCMNSGKVRLNSGILERRHSKWDKALQHFRMARQIDDTYCEPDYWIGATLLQQGTNLELGLLVGLTSAPSPMQPRNQPPFPRACPSS